MSKNFEFLKSLTYSVSAGFPSIICQKSLFTKSILQNLIFFAFTLLRFRVSFSSRSLLNFYISLKLIWGFNTSAPYYINVCVENHPSV